MNNSSHPQKEYKVFVAGATSFTGRAFAKHISPNSPIKLYLQVRENSKQTHLLRDPRKIHCNLDKKHELYQQLELCDTIINCVGIRKKFHEHTHYQDVDRKYAQILIEAAKHAKVKHFIQISSIGAGAPIGTYLKSKRGIEKMLIASKLPYTIIRPSLLAGDTSSDERQTFTNLRAFLHGLSDSIFGAPFALLRPIQAQELALILEKCVDNGPSNQILKGENMFKLLK